MTIQVIDNDTGNNNDVLRPSQNGMRKRRERRSRLREKKRAGRRIIPALSLLCFLVMGLPASASFGPIKDEQKEGSNGGRRRLYRPSRYHPPSRPSDAPPVDYGGVHPFEVWQERQRGRRAQEQLQQKRWWYLRRSLEEHNRDSRELELEELFKPGIGSTDTVYEPIRIEIDASNLEESLHNEISLGRHNSTMATKLYLLTRRVLPALAKVWGDVVRVVPVQGGIQPLVGSSNNKETMIQTDGSVMKNKRGEFCPVDKTSGIDAGADLLIYVTVDQHCEDGNGIKLGKGGINTNTVTLASAMGCARDQFDRPITGAIDFCLAAMTRVTKIDVLKAMQEDDNAALKKNVTEPSSQLVDPTDLNFSVIGSSINVAIHELGHVLGVSSDSLSYYRHPLTGVPLTPRPFTLSAVTCVNGEEMIYLGKPPPSVLSEGFTSRGTRHYEVATPTVRSVVRNQFNCPTLKGARLENQPTGSNCFGSHWDERLFYTETMSAIFHRDSFLSPLTLALLEDSGWYRANYESPYVRISPFGHGAGCDFVNKDCIFDGEVPPYGKGSFCDKPMFVDNEGHVDDRNSLQTCDPTYTQKASCDLVNANLMPTLDMPPPEYQYFPDNNGLTPHHFFRADYCPIPDLNNVDCTNVWGESMTQEYISAGEVFGPTSKCVDVTNFDRSSMCLRAECDMEIGKLRLAVLDGNTTITCEYDGQVHALPLPPSPDGVGRTPFWIECPRLAQICPDMYCPKNCCGRGTCVHNDTRDGPRAECQCNHPADASPGCYDTELSFPNGYGDVGLARVEFQLGMSSFVMIIVIVIGGICAMHFVIRSWWKRQTLSYSPLPRKLQIEH